MFEFFNLTRKRRLNHDQLQMLQMVAQQVVLSLEGSVRLPGATKKALALRIVPELLEQLHVEAPNALIDTAVEAAVKMLKLMEER